MKCKVYYARQLKELVGEGDGGIFLWQRLTESRKIINFSYIDVCNNSSGERLGKNEVDITRKLKWRIVEEELIQHAWRVENIYFWQRMVHNTIVIICDWSSAITNWSLHISHPAHSSGSTKLFKRYTRYYCLVHPSTINSKWNTKFKQKFYIPSCPKTALWNSHVQAFSTLSWKLQSNFGGEGKETI